MSHPLSSHFQVRGGNELQKKMKENTINNQTTEIKDEDFVRYLLLIVSILYMRLLEMISCEIVLKSVNSVNLTMV